MKQINITSINSIKQSYYLCIEYTSHTMNEVNWVYYLCIRSNLRGSELTGRRTKLTGNIELSNIYIAY